jgi:thiol-disulfide isomerase/thioredoxin
MADSTLPTTTAAATAAAATTIPSMTTHVVEFTGNRNIFFELLKINPGVFGFKFGAEWCKPCQMIKKQINDISLVIPDNVMYIYNVDVDECFDVYAFLKQKKMISGIPTLLAYKKGNTYFVPDASISGTNENDINNFFNTCLKML